MKTSLLSKTNHAFGLFAALAIAFGISVGVPQNASAYDDQFVKKVKTKNHKVKVKTVGGKAKIKDKANGKHKVKVKGPNGEIAHAIAHDAAGGGHTHSAKQGYYPQK